MEADCATRRRERFGSSANAASSRRRPWLRLRAFARPEPPLRSTRANWLGAPPERALGRHRPRAPRVTVPVSKIGGTATQPLISVVIGSFNRRRFLRHTLNSVRAELDGI